MYIGGFGRDFVANGNAHNVQKVSTAYQTYANLTLCVSVYNVIIVMLYFIAVSIEAYASSLRLIPIRLLVHCW